MSASTATETTSPTATESSDPTTDSTTDITTSDDPSTGTTDPTSVSTGSESGGGATVTIYEIQQGDVRLDAPVAIEGAICTGVGNNGFFAQDPAGGEWSGIWVFTAVDGPFPALGDVVTVSGTYEEYFDLSEINAGDGEVTITESPGAGNVPPAEIITLAEMGESWESVFVRVEGGTFTVAELSGMAGNNEFRVADVAGEMGWVDDQLHDVIVSGDFPGFGIGASFTALQGPLNYSFGEFKFAPRSVADFAGYAAP